MWRTAYALAVQLLCLLPANAAELSLPKSVYYYGEPIVLTYDVEGAWFEEIYFADVGEDGRIYGIKTFNPREEQGIITFDSRELVYHTPGSFFEADWTRNLLAFFLEINIEGTNEFRTLPVYFWIVRPQTAWPGSIVTARTRIFQGEDLEVTIRGLDEILADNEARRDDQEVLLRLVRLGQYLPGGALLADSVIHTEDRHLRSGMDRVVLGDKEHDAFHRLHEGHYEVQLIGVTGALLDSAAFTIAPPAWQGALRLEPETGGVYPYHDPPKVYLDRPRDEVVAVFDSTDGYRFEIVALQMFDKDVGSERNRVYGHYIRDRMDRGEPVIDLLYTSGGLYPGPHEVWLQVPLALDRSFVVDRAVFALGGVYTSYRPKRQEPELAPDDVRLSLSPGTRVEVGSPLTLTVELPDDIDPTARRMWASLHRRPTFGFECGFLVDQLLYDDSLYPRLAVTAEDTIRFPAPPLPERWELRLWEPDEWNQAVYLGKLAFDTELTALPGALSLAETPSAGQPLRVRYEIPEALPTDYYEIHYEIQLLRSAERAPDGNLPARQAGVREIMQSHSGIVEFDALWSPGLYELHLLVDDGFYARAAEGFSSVPLEPFVLDRLTFDLVHPDAPPLPDDYAFARAPGLDPLPTEEDPRRGLAVWWPPFDECEEPSFPTPPELLVTERLTGDPDDPADDRYEAVAAPFPGHPYFIEARFAEAPPEERYRVHLDDSLRVKVWRTADPFVYRSKVVTFLPEQAQ
jgi:hypothetical protein